jgi:putative transposase
MMKNRCLARSIASASWSKFVTMLQYKGEWYGCNVIQIGRFDPSSKLCSCGIINHDLRLKDRSWTCKKCGKLHDRDVLAANNIKDFAFHKQNLIQYRVGLTQINARGDDKVTEQRCSVVV